MTHKFLLHAFVGLLAAAALSACNNGDDENNDNNVNDNTITVAVENGSSYSDKVDAVKALVGYDVDGVGCEVGSAPYANGGFTLQLQANVDEQYLEAMFGSDDADLLAGATISNHNVKGITAKIVACKSDKEVGEFSCGREDDAVQGMLVYVDGDVSVTGTTVMVLDYTSLDGHGGAKIIYTFNLHLKKGWNMTYANTAEKNRNRQTELTSTAPSEAKWLFSPYSTVEIIDNTITATVESSYYDNVVVDAVRAMIFPIGYDGIATATDPYLDPEILDQLYEVGSGPYANGGFTLRLQDSVDAKYLEAMFERDSENEFSGATVSNPDVKGIFPTIYGYQSGELIAYLFAYSSTDGSVIGQLVYVDGNVLVKGSGTESYDDGGAFSYTLNLDMKRGWNMMYMGANANGVEVTTTSPTNIAWALVSVPGVLIYGEVLDYGQQPLSGASLKKQLRASSKRLQASSKQLQASSKQLQAPSKRMKYALKLFR
ncbi:MAG: hypothetical protein LBF55_01445 [Prevotellaceae bacterium]|jgi:hypothetical protein|nr:hypothetical protein [Prevotellaceae bacterium]